MSNSQISASWTLQHSSESVLSFMQGMLTAATSDNIQPLAILVAEAFGNTLAICQQTQMLVEKEAGKRHVSHVIKFLHAKVGYAANDTAFQLSLTSAGVRFMSLVAALLCTDDILNAARAIDIMINATSRSDQLMPTVFQIRDLISALGYKLRRLQFAESVAGWENYIITHTSWAEDDLSLDRHPTVGELAALVSAFRSVERIGDASSVVIRSGKHLAWIIAFTKWCLGYPPHVTAEDGTVFVEQNPSKVAMIIERGKNMAIEVFRELQGLPELLECSKGNLKRPCWSGLISVKAYGTRRLRHCGLQTQVGPATMLQVLLTSIRLVTKHLNVGRSQILDDYSQFGANIWPSDLDLLSTIASFCGLDDLPNEIPEDLPVSLLSLPTISAYEDRLLQKCKCRLHAPDKPADTDLTCKIQSFRLAIVDMSIDILAIAVLDFEEDVRIVASPLPPFHRSLFNAVEYALYWPDDLRGRKVAIQDIFERSLSLLGHTMHFRMSWSIITSERCKDSESDWIASEFMGQVVYPAHFDFWNDPINSRPLAGLRVCSGSILYKDRRYEYVKYEPAFNPLSTFVHEAVPCHTPLNLLWDRKVQWHVREEDGYLSLGMGLTSSFPSQSPMKALEAACVSLFVPACTHPADTPLPQEEPYSGARFITPFYRRSIPEGKDAPICIVAASKDEGLRSFALSTGEPAVVRGSA